MTPITFWLGTYLPLTPPHSHLAIGEGAQGQLVPQDFGSISKRAFCESACSPPGLLLPHPPPVSDARTAHARTAPARTHRVPGHPTVSRMAPLGPSPRLPLWIPTPAPGPAVQLLLLLLLLVPAHPQSLLWMQGTPTREEIHLGKMIHLVRRTCPVKRIYLKRRTHLEKRTYLD